MANPLNNRESEEERMFCRALTSAMTAVPNVDDGLFRALTHATSHLNDHLLPSLEGLAIHISPLSATAAATIIYDRLPQILESLRKYAHDSRGAQFEMYCVAHSITAPGALSAIWETLERLWEQAAMRACAFALKFADALREEKKGEEERKADHGREREVRRKGKKMMVDRGMQTD